MRYVLDIIKGAISLLSGMSVTIKAFFSPVVTVQYPRATIDICPSHSIQKVEGEKREGEKKKTLTSYILNFTTCSQCGICVETCPTDALAFSADYNPASFNRDDFHYDLLKEYEKRKNR
jgi:formate hydrogenlyase subunit 6/NADH:ubiquinone oxidoreductase subunit I